MADEDVRALVTDERDSLLASKASISEAVVTRPHRAQTVAVGLLALGDTEEAKTWFQELTEEWVVYAGNSWDAKYQEEPRRSAQRGPWEDYINGMYSAILGRQDLQEVAKEVYERATAPFVDDLENRELAHRVDLARSLSAHLLGKGEAEKHAAHLEETVQGRDNPWALDRYLPYVRVIRGLQASSASEVSGGIEGLLDFHRERVASARDADAVQKAVALDATAMLALARREGLNITVDHHAIPDALNDDEHYPVGE